MRRKLWLPRAFIVVAAIGGLAATLVSGSSPELGLDLQGGVSVVLEPTSKREQRRPGAVGRDHPRPGRRPRCGRARDHPPGRRHRRAAAGGEEPRPGTRAGGTDGGAPVPPGAAGSHGIRGDPSPTRTRATTTTTAEGGAGTTTTTGRGATTTTAPDENAAGLPLGRERRRRGRSRPPRRPHLPTTTTAPGAPAEPGPVPLTSRQDDEADAPVTLQGKDGEGVFQLGPALATGQIVSSARAEIPQGQWLVALSMKGGADGIDKFNEIAAQCNPPSATCPMGRLAIVLDSVVQSAPTIDESSYSKDESPSAAASARARPRTWPRRWHGSLPVSSSVRACRRCPAPLGRGLAVGRHHRRSCAWSWWRWTCCLTTGHWAGDDRGRRHLRGILYSIVSRIGETRGLALTLAGATGITASIGVTVHLMWCSSKGEG